jgi:L-iditol 2-dehydrogenase
MHFEKPKEVKAAVMLGPGKMEIRKYPYPTIDDTSAIVRMEISGICGTDKHIFKGETLQPRGETIFPMINGHENVGIIIEIGKEAAKCMDGEKRELKVGDRVTIAVEENCGECWFCRNQYDAITCENQISAYGCHPSADVPPYLRGGWAEYMFIAPKTVLWKIPDSMSNDLALFVEEMAVAYGALIRAMQPFPTIGEGFGLLDSVVVLGNGALGILHGIMGRIFGAGLMIATDLAENRLEMAKNCYANETINASKIDSPERIQKVKDLTEKRGADLVIETAGRPEVFVEALEMARKGGTVLELGNWADVGYDAKVNVMKHITMKNLNIHGLITCGTNKWGKVIKILEKYSNMFPFEKLISHKMSLEEVVNNMNIAVDPNRSMKSVVVPHKKD